MRPFNFLTLVMSMLFCHYIAKPWFQAVNLFYFKSCHSPLSSTEKFGTELSCLFSLRSKNRFGLQIGSQIELTVQVENLTENKISMKNAFHRLWTKRRRLFAAVLFLFFPSFAFRSAILWDNFVQNYKMVSKPTLTLLYHFIETNVLLSKLPPCSSEGCTIKE